MLSPNAYVPIRLHSQSPTGRRSRMLLAGVALSSAAVLLNSPLAQAHPDQGHHSTESHSAAFQPTSFADLIEKTKPAVISVHTSAAVSQRAGNLRGGAPWDPQWQEFFDDFFSAQPGVRPHNRPHRQQPQQPSGRQQQLGQGSGFIVSADGYVMTNHHVIDGAEKITVMLDDGTELEATLVGHDEKTDLALLKVEHGKPLPFVKFGNSDRARVGDWVLAIGNPFGLGGTATTGIISARGRDIQSGPFDDFIQIDAPINRGNSGGPLFNSAGEVIGINTAIYSPNGGNVGIGFAVPAAQAAPVFAELKTTGFVQRGWLGVAIQNIDEAIAKSLGLENNHGALVAEVVADSPAAKAGLRSGDVIVKFGEHDINDIKALTHSVAAFKPGQQKVVTVWRQGKLKTLAVQLGSQAKTTDLANSEVEQDNSKSAQLGVSLADLTDTARKQLRLPANAQGALISGTNANGPAARSGLRRGDLITMVNQQRVNSAKEVIQQLEGTNRDSVLLQIQRGKQKQFLALQLK